MKNKFLRHTNVAIVVIALSNSLFANAETKIVFPEGQLEIGAKKIQVEIADNSERAARGLMYRTSLAEGRGMIFIFPEEKLQNFWMKNTFIPLSIGFFGEDKKLTEMLDMEPVKSEIETPKTYSSSKPALYVLEVPLGWFQRNKIKVGDKMKLIEKKKTSKTGPKSGS